MRTCILLAPGPSLTREQAAGAAADIVGAIGNAFELCPEADFIAATDLRWWQKYAEAHRSKARKFCGVSIPGADVSRPPGAQRDWNSGVLALEVASQLGAEVIELYGFDMWGTHFFGPYRNGLANTPPGRRLVHQQQYREWKAAHPQIRVINRTKGSLLEAYPWER